MDKRKSVLVFGAGHVSRPLVEYLTRDESITLTVVSECADQCTNIFNSINRKNIKTIVLDVTIDEKEINELINDSDAVVNLLPFNFHNFIAKKCINLKTNLITTNYLTQDLIDMNEDAINAGIIIINEMGLDPGIDHLLAMQCFNDVKQNNGKILSFISYCGGLPAPQFSNNAIKYKFSWSPIKVLLNTMNPAKWLENGCIIEIPYGGELMDYCRRINFLKHLNLEGHPNRDSTVYKDMYELNDAHTVLRGTLRYGNFCDIMKGFLMLGLFDNSAHPLLLENSDEITWRELICELLHQERDISNEELKNKVFDRVERSNKRLTALEDLGFLSQEPIQRCITPIDTVAAFLDERLPFKYGETDIVIMHIEIKIQWPNDIKETRYIDFVVRGESHADSAMAKCVGKTAAIATKLILDGAVKQKGMIIPITNDLYDPILKSLAKEGIKANIKSVKK